MHTTARLRLRDYRRARQLTQAQLALLAGISQSTICRAERDRIVLSGEARDRLRRGLGLTHRQAAEIAELS